VTHGSIVNVITLTGYSGTDTFKLTYNGVEGATTFTRGTNYTSAAIQTALRAMDASLAAVLVEPAGAITDAFFDVVFPAGTAQLSDITVTTPSGVTGATTHQDVSGAVAGTNSNPAALAITDVTALTVAQRRDLQWLLAAGQIIPVI
jgi:hypothetical protein